MHTEDRARAFGIEVIPLPDIMIDVTIDGADEIAPNLDLIKGLGARCLREKIVAQNSQRLVVIADAGKLVKTLGTHGPLPIEVAKFAVERQEQFLRSLGCEPALCRTADGSPFITDNGNHIYDCRFKQIDVPAALETALKKRAGVVETGLFLGIAKCRSSAIRIEWRGSDNQRTIFAAEGDAVA